MRLSSHCRSTCDQSAASARSDSVAEQSCERTLGSAVSFQFAGFSAGSSDAASAGLSSLGFSEGASSFGLSSPPSSSAGFVHCVFLVALSAQKQSDDQPRLQETAMLTVIVGFARFGVCQPEQNSGFRERRTCKATGELNTQPDDPPLVSFQSLMVDCNKQKQQRGWRTDGGWEEAAGCQSSNSKTQQSERVQLDACQIRQERALDLLIRNTEALNTAGNAERGKKCRNPKSSVSNVSSASRSTVHIW